MVLWMIDMMPFSRVHDVCGLLGGCCRGERSGLEIPIQASQASQSSQKDGLLLRWRWCNGGGWPGRLTPGQAPVDGCGALRLTPAKTTHCGQTLVSRRHLKRFLSGSVNRLTTQDGLCSRLRQAVDSHQQTRPGQWSSRSEELPIACSLSHCRIHAQSSDSGAFGGSWLLRRPSPQTLPVSLCDLLRRTGHPLSLIISARWFEG